MSKKITREQMYIAYQIARKFGHEWTRCISEAQAFTKDWTEEEITTIVDNLNEHNTFPYIQAPFVDEKGNIGHETYNHRFEWEIASNGSAWIKINRPQGVVFTISFDFFKEKEDSVYGDSLFIERNKDIPVYWRHIEAVRFALSAIYPYSRVDRMIADLIEDNPDIMVAQEHIDEDGKITHYAIVPGCYEGGPRRWLLLERNKWTAGKVFWHENWKDGEKEVLRTANDQTNSLSVWYDRAFPLEGEALPQWIQNLVTSIEIAPMEEVSSRPARPPRGPRPQGERAPR